jgi:arylsulfatase A-like enzyme
VIYTANASRGETQLIRENMKIQLTLAGIIAATAILNAAVTKRPNIVLMYADDMGYGEVQALNPERGKIPTPNLDKLITEGMTFTDAHTASSVCTPSRYALLTGRYAWRTRLQGGVLTGAGEPLIAENRLTLAKMLKENGYSTAISGKWHLDFHYDGPRATVGTTIPDGPITRGFDTWLGFHHARNMKELCKDDQIIEIVDPIEMLPRTTDFAVDYINQKAADAKNGKPFFLYVPFGSPHTPIVPTEEWIGKSGLGKYGDFVMMTDGMAGRVIDAIDANGLADNTIVIFSSDNGTSRKCKFDDLKEQGHYPSAYLRGSKADLWDGGHRVPFILRWPNGGVNPGSRCDQLIGLSDMTATVADLIGYELPENAAEDSLSFLPAIHGKQIVSEREAIVHHSISGHFAIRKGKWKLLLASGSGGWTKPVYNHDGPQVQLYDMSKDLSEQKNLQAEFPEVVSELTKLLESYVANGRSTPGSVMKNDAEIDIWKENLGVKKTKKRKSVKKTI